MKKPVLEVEGREPVRLIALTDGRRAAQSSPLHGPAWLWQVAALLPMILLILWTVWLFGGLNIRH